MPLHVEVVTQQRKLLDVPEADIVVVPGRDGVMGVLPNHAPLLTTMQYGELIVRQGNAEESFIVYGGVVEIRPDKVTVLADEASFTNGINIREAEAARERIAQILEEGVPPEERTLYLQEMRKAELAINVYRRTQSRAGSIRIVSDEDLYGDE
jgi:F-type H+-transporting ATPase subunit epsilon